MNIREKKYISGFDSIVLALGVRANNPLEEKIKEKVKEIYVVGEALKPGQANTAIEETAQVELKI